MKGHLDGQAFDSDYASRRSVFQYNYSHENEGGFMLVCSPGTSFNEGTVIRYNISQHDGISSARVFQFGGNVSKVQIYNNSIYVGRSQRVPMIVCGEWDGGVPGEIRFTNNLFVADGEVSYDLAAAKQITFSHNLFYGRHRNPPQQEVGSVAQLGSLRLGSGKHGLASLEGYRPVGVDFPRGIRIADHGGRDFFGTSLPTDQPPAIGAAEPRRIHGSDQSPNGP